MSIPRFSVFINTSLFSGILYKFCVNGQEIKNGHSVSLWVYSRLDLDRFISFLIYTQSVRLFCQGISQPQGRYLHTEHNLRINADRHPCLEWDSTHEDGSCLKTAWSLWSANGHLPYLILRCMTTKAHSASQKLTNKNKVLMQAYPYYVYPPLSEYCRRRSYKTVHVLHHLSYLTYHHRRHNHRRNSPFWAIVFLRRTGFRNSNCSTEQGRQPCVQLPTWRTRSLYLFPLVTGWTSYIAGHRLPFSSPSYDSQGYGGGVLTRLHTIIINLQENENVNTESDKWFIMENAWVNSYITWRHSQITFAPQMQQKRYNQRNKVQMTIMTTIIKKKKSKAIPVTGREGP
jgi:hypothetical protein